jgi:hypothetical protein
MKIEEAIHTYITSQPEAKCKDMQVLHQEIVALMPHCRLWFLDGKNAENKIVSNPNIGYGIHTLQYANGSSKEFYQIGMSANTTGISIYIMGLADKNYLAQTYGTTLGKASISGYCIKFKSLQDINLEVLKAAIRHGVA